MNKETVKPVIRETAHGKLYIFLYDTIHRVYLVKDGIETFLYDRYNTSLSAYNCK